MVAPSILRAPLRGRVSQYLALFKRGSGAISVTLRPYQVDGRSSPNSETGYNSPARTLLETPQRSRYDDFPVEIILELQLYDEQGNSNYVNVPEDRVVAPVIPYEL